MSSIAMLAVALAVATLGHGGDYSRAKEQVERGKELLRMHCSACHHLERTHIGPALGGVTEARGKTWLMDFAKDPTRMIESGDPQAVALLEQYNMAMPGFAFLGDADLESVFAYIDSVSEERSLSYRPLGNDPGWKQRIHVPTEPIRFNGLSLVLSDYATVPGSPRQDSGTRLASMRTIPNDRSGTLFVNDQNGYLYRIGPEGVSLVFDAGERFSDFVYYPGLATGFGSFAFHPDFLSNGLLYITHTEAYAGRSGDYEYGNDRSVALQWVVSEWALDQPGRSFEGGRWRELLRINAPSTVHGAQDIAFNPEAKAGDEDFGLLYIGIGDGGAVVEGFPELCHNLKSPLGSIVRIDPLGTNSRNGRYGIPRGNPFADEADADVWKEIYAYGFRNPHRLAWDRGGRLLATDVGEGAYEEINLVEPGKDYGWNVREGNIVRAPNEPPRAIPWDVEEPEYTKPLAVYSHLEGNAISGGFVYRGSVEALKGKYLFGDIVSGRVFCIDMASDSEGLQSIEELQLADESGSPFRLREVSGGKRVDLRFGEDDAGELYIMSKFDGRIRKVVGGLEL